MNRYSFLAVSTTGGEKGAKFLSWGVSKQWLEDPTNYRLHIRLYPCVTGAESGSTDRVYSNILAELQES